MRGLIVIDPIVADVPEESVVGSAIEVAFPKYAKAFLS